MTTHQCKLEFTQPVFTGANPDLGGYGPAIETTIVFGSDGKWWAGNGEYATPIAFCPWCGVKLDSLRGA